MKIPSSVKGLDPGPAIVALSALVALFVFALNNGIDPVLLSVSIMVAAKPLLLAAIGEVVVEKSGVLNLGVEGMMIIGAIAGFAVSVETGLAAVGFVSAALAGAVMALLFGVLTQFLHANQVATGLALWLFCLGLAALIGQPYAGIKPPAIERIDIPGLSDLPVLGPILFGQDPMVYVTFVLVTLVWIFLSFTRAGMVLRAVGENHDAAHALGYRVVRTRLAAIAFGGACAGLGGAYLSLIRVPQWTEGMTAGAGWIALAIVVFGAWRPWRVVLGAYLFGGITILQLNFQAASITPLWLLVFGLFLLTVNAVTQIVLGRRRPGLWAAALFLATLAAAALALSWPISLPAQYLSMTPYLATILVLAVMSADKLRTTLNAPAMLGRVFHRQG